MALTFLKKLGIISPAPQYSPTHVFGLVKAGEAVLIDVREELEIVKTGLPFGAVNIPLRAPNFAEEVQNVIKTQRTPLIAITCLSGARSSRAVLKLQKAGVQNLVIVKGGLGRWKKADLPLTKHAFA